MIGQDEDLQQIMYLLESGYFNQFEPDIFDDLINSIKNLHDPWMTIAKYNRDIWKLEPQPVKRL